MVGRLLWELGSYQCEKNGEILVVIHPNRNPSQNGIQLVFLQQQGSPKKKLGFLLMINHVDEASSQLLGLKVVPEMRGQGLAKLLLAVWLRCCLDADITPTTGIMRKPLLSHILENTFDFLPSPTTSGMKSRGCQARLLPLQPGDPIDRINLCPTSKGYLPSVLSPSDCRNQNIRLVSHIEEESYYNSSSASVISRSPPKYVWVGANLSPPSSTNEL